MTRVPRTTTHSSGDTFADDEAVPASLVVLGSFRDRIDGADSYGAILHDAHYLGQLHTRRAGLVSARGELGVSDHHVAACVHLIDEIDCARAQCVLSIDRLVARAVSGRAPVLHSETLGAVVDRLSQRWVAMNTADRQYNSEQSHRSSCAVAELAAAYDDLVADLAAGRRQVPQW